MFRSTIPTLFATILLAAPVLSARPARAADVIVQVAGRTDQQVRRDVTAAAVRVCTAAEVHVWLETTEECINDTIDITMRQIRTNQPDQLAAR